MSILPVYVYIYIYNIYMAARQSGTPSLGQRNVCAAAVTSYPGCHTCCHTLVVIPGCHTWLSYLVAISEALVVP